MMGIVIGGSAGSLEALQALFATFSASATTNAAVFIVVHISPVGDSLLPGVIGAYTSMPVREAVDKLPITAGTVVVAPPDYHMLIERDMTIALSRDPHEHFSRPAIDPLFATAALAFGANCRAVLLSGSNADGAAGTAAVRAAGGKVAVQHPDSSSSTEMPRAALDLGAPDFIGDGAAIGQWLFAEIGGGR